jgi:hypothetical protein
MAERSVGRLILVPAVLTLAVTALRLTGELLGWAPALFSRAAGGAAALVGIVWLVPVFGAHFGWRLAREGAGPASPWRAAGWALVALLGHIGLLIALFSVFRRPVAQLAILFVTSWLFTLFARRAWPELWRVLIAYAFAARLPVLAAMFLSIFGGWDTHYAKPRPDFPPMGHAGLFFWTALLPQLGVWVWFTVVAGLLFGILAAAVARRRSGRATVPVAAA